MEEIANIIYEYSINKKLADKDFVNKIVNILSDMYGLEYYIKGMEVSKKIFDGSDYSPRNKTMTINIFDSRMLLIEPLPLLVKNKALFVNLDIALAIFHEADHALLMKLKELGKDSIDVKLYNLISDEELIDEVSKINSKDELTTDDDKKMISNMLKVSKDYIYYQLHHDEAPHERRAIINSHMHLSRIIDILYDTDLSSKDLDKIRYYQLGDFLKICLEGYKKMGEVTNSPSYDYVKKITSMEDLEKIDIYDYNPFRAYNNVKLYKLKDRILYGLPLESPELKKINRKSNPFHVYEKRR